MRSGRPRELTQAPSISGAALIRWRVERDVKVTAEDSPLLAQRVTGDPRRA
jgi:hypothetical protein